MRESKIEEAVWRYAHSKGFEHYKFTSPARGSVPDRLFVTPNGVVFFIEFKATGEKPTVPQMREHDRLRSKHQIVYVCDNIDYGKQIIDAMEVLVKCPVTSTQQNAVIAATL